MSSKYSAGHNLAGHAGILTVCILAGLLAPSLPAQAESPEQSNLPFHNLRYLDGFSPSGDKAPDEFWAPYKYIPLANSPYGPLYLTLGGEVRERYETYRNINFGLAGAPSYSGYLLQRITLDADVHATDWVRGFVQLGDMRIFGKRGVPSTTDTDYVDVMQGFADLKLPTPLGDEPVVRYGREELLFGYQRLIAVREGPNVRRDFDGFRFTDKIGEATIDYIDVRPTLDRLDAFDDTANLNQHLTGVYATVPLIASLKSDIYWLNYQNLQAKFRGLTGAENRDTFGARLFGKLNGFDLNAEAATQSGTFRDQDISAFFLAGVFGYTFENLPWKPRLGFSANYASGDNANSKTIGTFNPIYPRLPYFAETSMLVPSNIKDIRPVFTLHPRDDVAVVLGYDMLQRVSATDGLYGSGLSQYKKTATVSGMDIGSEASIDVRRNVRTGWQLGVIAAEFFSGPAVTDAFGKDVTFTAVYSKYLF
jgi:Alginate export